MFISCGDTLVDLFSQPAGKAGEVSLAGHVGGSPLNVALGLARLGNPAGLLCKNSTDFIGRKILEYLRSNDVDLQWVVPTGLNSTLAMVQKQPDGSASYAFYIDNTADRSLEHDELPEHLPDTLQCLHFGSYSTVLEPTGSSLLSLARAHADHCLVSYDPNIRPSIEPDMSLWRTAFDAFSAVAGLVKASDEDIASLFGPGKDHDEFATELIAREVSLVAITRGAEGAQLYTADGRQVSLTVPSVKVVDTVGAGDTFQAACLHFLAAHDCLDDKGKVKQESLDLEELGHFAARAAAITCTRHGADLPRLHEINAFTA